MQEEIRICQYCKSEIPRDKKICPVCHRKESHPFKVIILCILGFFVISLLSLGIGAAINVFGYHGRSTTKDVPKQKQIVIESEDSLYDNSASIDDRKHFTESKLPVRVQDLNYLEFLNEQNNRLI